MKKQLILFSFVLLSISSFSQNRILVFHETNGFRHGSITDGITMFEDLGNENNDWITDNSQDSSVFTDANLAQYDAVIFLNTSGSDETGNDGDLLSASEKIAFENFILSGKGFIGIHAATDTYRDGVWPFYNELVGGIVQTNPNHTSNGFNADIEVIISHPVVDFLGAVGSIWNKNEEYYYWQNNGGQLSSDNTVLLEVESTGSNSYDAERPITWYKESITYDDDSDNATPDVTLSGFRSFYTALGHNGNDYNTNTNFRTLLKNATLWAINDTTLNLPEEFLERLKIFPNPTNDIVFFIVPDLATDVSVTIFNHLGQEILTKNLSREPLFQNNTYELNMEDFESGSYIVKLRYSGNEDHFKLIKI